MTPITAAEATKKPLTSDAEIEERAELLVGRACRRQLWMFFLDEGGVQMPLLVPLEDYPTSPAAGNAEFIASRIPDMLEQSGASQIVVVWERRLGEASTPADRVWAAALAAECKDRGVHVRAQLLSHRRGVRMLPAAEYAASGGEAAPVAEDQ